jgi:hypothetical protein
MANVTGEALYVMVVRILTSPFAFYQGYLPLNAQSRLTTLARKRSEYLSLVEVAFAKDRDGLDQQIWHQIEIDVPRTRPGVQLWMHNATQRVCIFLFLFSLSTSSMLIQISTEFRANIICVGVTPSC